MLVERGADASALPETVQGIIAARLDALSSQEKSLLQDAAVIGRTVWLGALCALGERDRAEADELVFRLERKQLLRRARRSSVAAETELSFAHSLIEEVAYAQLTRPQRAERHERAAAWVERLAGDRDDRAELVAHHLTAALELRDALGQNTSALRARTLAALVAAARQAAARHDPAATISCSSATGLVVSTTSATFGGWTVGIGGEYAFTDWLSGFVEYDYYKLRHPIDHARHDRGHPPDTSQHQGIRQRVQGRPEPSTESRPGLSPG